MENPLIMNNNFVAQTPGYNDSKTITPDDISELFPDIQNNGPNFSSPNFNNPNFSNPNVNNPNVNNYNTNIPTTNIPTRKTHAIPLYTNKQNTTVNSNSLPHMNYIPHPDMNFTYGQNPVQQTYNSNMNNPNVSNPNMNNPNIQTMNPNMNNPNLQPTYNQPNYGMHQTNQTNRGTMMGQTSKANVAMSRMTKMPGTKSVSGMTMVPKAEPKKINVKKKEIVYPEFLGAHQHLTDPFWIRTLTAASYGTFPKLVFYRNSIITYKKSIKQTFTLELTGTDLEKCKMYITFLQEKLSIKSDMDDVRNTEQQQNDGIYLDNMYKSWKDVRKKAEREALLNNFITESIRFLKLNEEERREFHQTVYRGYYSGAFNDTIIISNGKITSITNIDWNYDNRELNIVNEGDNKAQDGHIISENVYLHPRMTINSHTSAVNLKKKMKSTIKIK